MQNKQLSRRKFKCEFFFHNKRPSLEETSKNQTIIFGPVINRTSESPTISNRNILICLKSKLAWLKVITASFREPDVRFGKPDIKCPDFELFEI